MRTLSDSSAVIDLRKRDRAALGPKQTATSSADDLATHAAFARIYQWATSLVIGALLLISGLIHLENPYVFLSSIYAYGIGGPELGKTLAILLPQIQLVTGICLLGRVFVGGAWFMSLAMFASFAGAQISVALREMDIDCGCFGPNSSSPVGALSITTISLLLAAAVVGLVSFVVCQGRSDA